MQGLPDYLAENLKILFVGYNPGEKSALLGHHYAGRGNQFWRLLHDSGLTQRLYLPEEDAQLLQVGYGLTNLVVRPSKSSADLSQEEMQLGAKELRQKVRLYRPALVCFLGKEVYRKFANLKAGAPVDYGLVQGHSMLEGVKEFVAPNPSGRSTIPYGQKLAIFEELLKIQILKEQGVD